MALPKVDLTNEEKYLVDTVPEGVVFNRATNKNQSLCKQKRCKAGIIVLVICIVAVVVALPIIFKNKISDEEETYHLRKHAHHGKGNCIPLPVEHDEQKQLIFVDYTAINTKHSDFVTTRVMHDYRNNISAFRDATNKRCYIEPLNRTFQNDMDILKWSNLDKPKPFKYYRTTFETNVNTAKDLWGSDVSTHCAGHRFFPLTLQSKTPLNHSSVKVDNVDHISVIFDIIINPF